MTDSSKLCLSCGLCCDGTLIGHVQLDTDEVSRVKVVLNIEEEKGHGFFLQPCSKYCDGCTVYSERPRQCASFKCGLLNSFEQKELNFESTAEIIKTVQIQKNAIEKALSLSQIELQSESFNFKMVELNSLLQKNKIESSLNPSQLVLLTKIEQLNSLVKKHFNVSLD